MRIGSHRKVDPLENLRDISKRISTRFRKINTTSLSESVIFWCIFSLQENRFLIPTTEKTHIPISCTAAWAVAYRRQRRTLGEHRLTQYLSLLLIREWPFPSLWEWSPRVCCSSFNGLMLGHAGAAFCYLVRNLLWTAVFPWPSIVQGTHWALIESINRWDTFFQVNEASIEIFYFFGFIPYQLLFSLFWSSSESLS